MPTYWRSRAETVLRCCTPSPSPPWGLHLVDANIELGNLITLVRREAAAYSSG